MVSDGTTKMESGGTIKIESMSTVRMKSDKTDLKAQSFILLTVYGELTEKIYVFYILISVNNELVGHQ